MPVISSINNSGPDIKAMVDAVVNAQMTPVEQSIKRQEEKLTHDQDTLYNVYQAVTSLEQSALWLANEAMQSNNSNMGGRWLAHSSDPERLGVRVTGLPDPGTYQLRVNHLASPQVLVSPLLPKGAIIQGRGSLHIALNGSSWTINLLQDSSLTSIARTIQLNTRGKIRGTVISDLDGQRLLLTGAEKGADWRIRLSGKDAGAELATMMSEQRAPADALVTINDVQLRLPGNVAQQAIAGLSIDLKRADEEHLITIDVQQDIEPLVEGINTFLDNCNRLIQVSDPRDANGRQVNADTPASIRSISGRLRKLMSSSVEVSDHARTPIQGLTDLGISTERDGRWSVNPHKLRIQLQLHPYQVMDFLKDPQQPIMMIAAHMQNLSLGNNALQSRTTYLSRSLQRLAEEQVKLDDKRHQLTVRTMRNFVHMDQQMKRFDRTRENIANALTKAAI